MSELPSEKQIKEAIRESNQDQRDLVKKARAKSRTIRDVLVDITFHPSDIAMDIERRKYALKEIETLIKASKPEKRTGDRALGWTELDAKDFGYNNGIDDYQANLLKILGGKQ